MWHFSKILKKTKKFTYKVITEGAEICKMSLLLNQMNNIKIIKDCKMFLYTLFYFIAVQHLTV